MVNISILIQDYTCVSFV